MCFAPVVWYVVAELALRKKAKQALLLQGYASIKRYAHQTAIKQPGANDGFTEYLPISFAENSKNASPPVNPVAKKRQ
ncbi:MAG: hypothetical protein HY796_05720 [Elusimicrobia bacterium]|nr:hypothetical protein [Elusimicrobiota bacterium]